MESAGAASLPGQVLANRYRLESLLAEGGMGAVWVARHLALDRLVAIKLMSGTTVNNETLRVRFEREARACARVQSPYVVRVFDYGLADETPFLVMDLLDGEDLATLVRRRGALPLAEAARYVQNAAKGLSAAHAAGIVHRDVKAGNLFVARNDAETVVKVLDFGIAKICSDAPAITRTGIMLGSPNYMSPEQLSMDPVDERTDVWSLGVVAFLLLTGELPFRGASSLDVGIKIQSGDRSRPSDAIIHGVTAELDVFFDRALANDRERRFATPLALGDALRAIASSHGNVVAPYLSTADITSAGEAPCAFFEPPEPLRSPAGTVRMVRTSRRWPPLVAQPDARTWVQIPRVTATSSWPSIDPTLTSTSPSMSYAASGPQPPVARAPRRGAQGWLKTMIAIALLVLVVLVTLPR